MIKQQSIDQVKDTADLTEQMNRYTTVKNKMACCPFHGEKTPSLSIKKNAFYKCFGCGKSGDVFTLIQEMEKLNFIESVEWLAKFYNINLDYDQQTQQEAQEVKDKRTEMFAATKFAYEKYCKLLQELPNDSDVICYLKERGYTKERAQASGFGYAPQEFKFISTPLINAGKYQPALECGLLSTRDGVSKDFFYNRIIIPIHDHNGVLVGMAGRQVPSGDKEKDKKYPKYLNPCESLIYNKKKVFYGLWQAQHAIKETGFAYLVEGYMDVDAMHYADVMNTVAACGTEVDLLQLKFLKRYTDHLVIGYDGDKAGTTKMMKTIDLCLQLDFKTQVLALPGEMDPDEYIRYILSQQKIAA